MEGLFNPDLEPHMYPHPLLGLHLLDWTPCGEFMCVKKAICEHGAWEGLG